MTIDSYTLGSFQVYGLRDGFFHLDGGAMFGVVPKTLWERIYPADGQNRIRLGLNSLLVRAGGSNLVVDTGMGTHVDAKLAGLYTVDNKPGLVSALEGIGVKRESIDIVINTHLHFDHCGGNTVVGARGEILPTFPRARYIIQKGEWESALKPNARDRASYLRQYFAPLKERGQLQLVEGDAEISDGVRVVLAAGHTAHHQCVKIQSDGKTLFFLGDMVPTSGHVGLPYVMSYDLFPLETMKNKEKFYQEAIKNQWTVAFNHDPVHFFGRIFQKNKKYGFLPL